jgi:hypothetical protein
MVPNRLAHALETEFLPAMRLRRQIHGTERLARIVDDAPFHGSAANIQPNE